ncbi:hypothetical protein TWF281_002286 [Arthrobotrys megalospora]
MTSQSPSSPYFLRSFNKLSTASNPDPPDTLEYIARPKPTLENIPLEILMQITCHLPDARSAVQLSSVNKSMHSKLAGSQYFWYRFGHRNLKKFQKFSKSYNYHGYVVKAMSGGIKSTCQVCLKPKYGIERKDMGKLKVVCVRCMEENIVLAEIVQKIPGLDRTKLHPFNALCNRELVRSGLGRSRGYTRSCYWLPDVKNEVERMYGLQWENIPTVCRRFDVIRPLVSPKEAREYCDKLVRDMLDIIVAKYREGLEANVSHILSLDTLTKLLNAPALYKHLRKMLDKMPAPTEGQADLCDYDLINDKAEVDAIYAAM